MTEDLHDFWCPTEGMPVRRLVFGSCLNIGLDVHMDRRIRMSTLLNGLGHIRTKSIRLVELAVVDSYKVVGFRWCTCNYHKYRIDFIELQDINFRTSRVTTK